MAATKKEDDDDEDEEEEAEEEDLTKKKKKNKAVPDKNGTYFGGIGISDSRRTQLAYVSVLLSLTGIVLAVFLFISGLREDSYLSDFSDLVKGYSGGGIFTMMMVIGVLAAVIQLFGCHVCFRATISTERKKLYYWIWVYMMALIVLLVAFVVANLVGLLYWLSANTAFKGGLRESMKLYESRLKVKSSIDRMQIDFECCGSTNYKDWWTVGWWGARWLDTNSKEVKKKMKDGRTYLTDSVPFSCCDPRVRRPCVHHNMLSSFQHTKYDSSNVTVYEIGCTRAMSRHYAQTVSSFLKLLVASLVVELSLTVTFRYLQTSTGTAIEEDDMDVETRGYLWTSGNQSNQKVTAGKDSKSPAAKKKGAAKSEKDKNRNNPRLNNNNLGPQSSYNNMSVGRVSKQAGVVGTKTLPVRDARGARPATVARMPSSATVQTSRQTSGTNVSGTSRQTSGTRRTVSTQDSGTKSASTQQSSNTVATRSASAVPPSATTSSSHASTIRRVPNASRNNNVGVPAQSSSSTVGAAQEKFQSESTSDLPQQRQQQQQQQDMSEVEAQPSPTPAVFADQHNTEPKQRPEVPRPLTPIPIPEVHKPAKLASMRFPRSIPLADFLVSPRSSLSLQASANSNVSNGNRPTPHDRTPSTGWNNAAIPLAAVHKPLTVGVHTPFTYRSLPSTATVQESSAPPPLPPRNVSIADESPYVMMYPLRPPRNHPMTTRPHRK